MHENQILKNLEHPEELEKLYRKDKKAFARDFQAVYPTIADKPAASFWKARLDIHAAGTTEKGKITRNDFLFLLLSAILAAVLVKLPDIFSFDEGQFHFYERNLFVILALGITLYTALSMGMQKTRKGLITLVAFALPVLFINLLPARDEGHAVFLSWIHTPLVLWCIFGLVHIAYDLKNLDKRINFLRYNGDLVILSTLIYIAGGVLTGVTLGLFYVIGVDIAEFYMENIVIFGFVIVPAVAAFLLHNYPNITNRLAPAIANIFVPLVLITLIIYLFAIPLAGIDLYRSRIFLIVFNIMLLGVMAIIVFSISEFSSDNQQKIRKLMLLLLCIITLIIDLIALSAIIYRLGEYGFSPNRTAVLGSNLLIFGNLALITLRFFRAVFMHGEIKSIEKAIAIWLPVYAAWVLIVVFTFPFIFGID
ncbi:MAG: hypothetical protein JW801_06140 [Bacteroidales bacterium]|nr:hypothetical protein [Bacteroidales bacterium]